MAVAGNRLYVTNVSGFSILKACFDIAIFFKAGSNTISSFSINVHRPTQLTLIGEPISSGGEFPISVAVSPRTGQVCVANAGSVNGVK